MNKIKSSITRLYGRVARWITTYTLTIRTALALLVLISLSVWVLYAFVDDSILRARTVRSELFDRDLRDLTSRFDNDERYVLDHNTEQLISERRNLTPLLLPRQYYIALPTGNASVFPRQPPRNCFISLEAASKNGINPEDRLCSYFVANRTVGQFLFLALDYLDESVVTLRPGDVKLKADTIKISVTLKNKKMLWWLTLQPHSPNQLSRYQVTAFRENAGVKELDRRLEGWAFSQIQSDGRQIIKLMARLDLRQFELDEDDNWPPANWGQTQLSLERWNYDIGMENPQVFRFNESGATNLSITSLAKTIFSAHATLELNSGGSNGLPAGIWPVADPSLSNVAIQNRLINIVDGDIVIRRNPIVRSLAIPDTGLSVKLSHPGVVVEKGVWRILIILSVFALVSIFAVFYFFKELLIPVYRLTNHLRALMLKGTDRELLPYSHHKNEIGILADGFNQLILKIRLHVTRELDAKLERESFETNRRAMVLKNREENLDIIGHEIRSPLQALTSLHGPGTESRRYLDRIAAALPHLQLGVSAEEAAAARNLDTVPVNLHDLLVEISSNAPLVDLRGVVFEGQQALWSHIDPEAFEDVIENILWNADRFRSEGSMIFITLLRAESNLIIRITNDGPPIPQEIMGKIFFYGFSTAKNENGYGKGIGLWIARSYLSRMGGTVEAFNIPGGGVCFEMQLPECSAPAAE